MNHHYRHLFFWLLLVCSTWLASMSWIWGKIGAAGVGLGLPISAFITICMVGTFCWLGRWSPGRKSLLQSAFLWGASVAGFCAIWSQESLQVLANMYGGEELTNWLRPLVITPVTEELFKGLFLVWMLIRRRSEMHGLLSGIIYGGLIGAGFAFTEQILYFGQIMVAYLNRDLADSSAVTTLVMSFLLRGVMVPYMHSFFVIFIGLGIAIAARSKRGSASRSAIVLAGFLIPIVLHGIWDWAGLASSDRFLILKIYSMVMLPLFLLLSIFALVLRRREKKTCPPDRTPET